MTLAEALGVRAGEVVAFIGAGGKTTAMYRLAADLAARGLQVIVTTTTKILPPDRPEVALVLEEAGGGASAEACGDMARPHESGRTRAPQTGTSP